MKQSVLSLLIGLVFIGAAQGQVKKVTLDINGVNFDVLINVGKKSVPSVTVSSEGDITRIVVHTKNGSVTVSATGDIIDADMDLDNVHYTSSGKPRQIGDTYFYYSSDKIRQIGDTYFYYYTSSGKIRQIGDTYYYYTSSGKLKSGKTVLNYDGITYKLKGVF